MHEVKKKDGATHTEKQDRVRGAFFYPFTCKHNAVFSIFGKWP